MKVYSEKDHRGNELLKNSGKAVSNDSATNKIQWGDFEDWTPTDGSGAGLSLTINSAKKTKVGKFVLAQFDITYPTTSNTNPARINGFPDEFFFDPDSVFRSIKTALIAISVLGFGFKIIHGNNYIVILDTTNANVTNLQLSGKRILFTSFYLTDAL